MAAFRNPRRDSSRRDPFALHQQVEPSFAPKLDHMPLKSQPFQQAANSPSFIERVGRQVELETVKRLQILEKVDAGVVSHDELTNLADIADLGRIKAIMDNPGGKQPGFALFRARHTVKAWSEAVALDFDQEDSVKPTMKKSYKRLVQTALEEWGKDPPKPGESLRDFKAWSSKKIDALWASEGRSGKREIDLQGMIVAAILAVPCTAAIVALSDWMGIPLDSSKVQPVIKDTKPKAYDPPEA
ncbi:uncharacterized protein BDZ99DRAFT_576897 [Mytilinidion resinicola]|uniref:Uncharacterized protein n=1 Tax=Mytilinidion resinicola TaxID=574789 RepID=A0A6A6Y2U5_9PEZI|nr:uncharacterized protein BDZ99DRAFT_576897 [Mytilinidion resinicola]KAF2802535.1 hypothetical protein BDZ99DRAFT_576897 [Mytilinidion resinicola]